MTSQWEPDVARGLAELRAAPDVSLRLSAMDAWLVLANLQLALRHPGNQGAAREMCATLALRIQNLIAPPGSALARMAQAGWDPAEDVERSQWRGRPG